jgi:hypothetical protein
MIFLLQIAVVDSLTLMQFCIKYASQSTGLRLAEVINYMGDLRPNVLLVSVHGLDTSYQYVQAAQGAIERKARVTILASFLMILGRATLTDPATNAAAGGTIASFIE